MRRTRTTVRAATLFILPTLLLGACDAKGDDRTIDAAGLTSEQVAGQTLHEEYDAYRPRYDHMQHLLAEAQRVVHDGEWKWNNGDTLPTSGGDGGVAGALRGSDDDNSYYLETARLWVDDDLTGAERDLDPMIDYFTSKGWGIEVRTIGESHDLWATPGDGWQIEYTVQTTGQYALSVYSELLWTNDYLRLQTAIFDRTDVPGPRSSLPGEYPPFPRWDSHIADSPRG